MFAFLAPPWLLDIVQQAVENHSTPPARTGSRPACRSQRSLFWHGPLSSSGSCAARPRHAGLTLSLLRRPSPDRTHQVQCQSQPGIRPSTPICIAAGCHANARILNHILIDALASAHVSIQSNGRPLDRPRASARACIADKPSLRQIVVPRHIAKTSRSSMNGDTIMSLYLSGRRGHSMLIDPLYSLPGFAVGLLVGMTGVGGGSLMTPLLVLLFGVHPATAVGTDLLYAAATKTCGSLVHGLAGSIKWEIVRRLATGSVPAAIATLTFL